MKLSIKLLSGLTLMALIAVISVAVVTPTQEVSAATYVDLGALAPDHASAQALYCDDADETAWYQVQKHDKDNANALQFTGGTVACSGWDAIRQFALLHGYESTNAASNDGVVAGNRGKTWIADLPSISTY